jgi:hypothetical protein
LAICLDGTPAAADAVTGPRHPEMCSCAAAAHFCLVAQAHPAVVPHARRSARHTLAAWRLGQIADDTELVVSELLTNASAPRGALLYPRYSREELKGGSWA